MRSAKAFLPFLVMLLGWASASGQAPVVADSYTNSTSKYASTNFGAANVLLVQGGIANSYLLFSMSRYPSGTTPTSVSKATLRLFVDGVSTGGTFDVYEVITPWTEKGIAANSAPGVGKVVASAVPVSAANINGFITVDVTAAVQDWLANPGANYGLALIPTLGSSIGVSFDSKEAPGNISTLSPSSGNVAIYTGHEAQIQVDYTDQSVKDAISSLQSADSTTLSNAESYAAAAVSAETTRAVAAEATKAPVTGSPNYVAKAGDTMTGQLAVPFNGFISGDGQLALRNGFVGVHTRIPSGYLHVESPYSDDTSSPRFFSSGMPADSYSQIYVGESVGVYKTGVLRYNNGGGNPALSRIQIFNYGDGDHTLTIAGGGMVGVRNYNPNYPLDVNGAVHASGNISAASFTGDGSGLTNLPSPSLTNLNASNLTTGTVPVGVMSGTYNISVSGNAATASAAANASSLNGVAGTNFARTDITNTFNGNQIVLGGEVGVGITQPTTTIDVRRPGGGWDNAPVGRFGTDGANDGNSVSVFSGSGVTDMFVASNAGASFVPGTSQGDGGLQVLPTKNLVFGNRQFQMMKLDPNGNETIPGTMTASRFVGDGSGLTNVSGANLSNLNASNLTSGTVPDARLNGTYSSALNLNNSGNIIAGAFTGTGAGLTNLPANNLTGTVADAQLSSNVALRNTSNTFVGTQTFTAGTLQITTNVSSPSISVNQQANNASFFGQNIGPGASVVGVNDGSGVGVSGGSLNGIGVDGRSTTGTFGVRGSVGTNGIGVYASSASGIGLKSENYSATQPASVFNNQGGGPILSGQNNGAEKFSVDGSGNIIASGQVIASKFVGDGSGLSGVTATAVIASEKRWLPAGTCLSGGSTTYWSIAGGNYYQPYSTCFGSPAGAIPVLFFASNYSAQQILSVPDNFASVSNVRIRWLPDQNQRGPVVWQVSFACIQDGVALNPTFGPTFTTTVDEFTIASGVVPSAINIPVVFGTTDCPAGNTAMIRIGRGTDSNVATYFSGAEVGINYQ